jgi:hypothetical protein
MSDKHYIDNIVEQSQAKFNLLKEKMLEPVKQVQKSRKENLKNLLTEIEKKQNLLQEKRVSLKALCQE